MKEIKKIFGPKVEDVAMAIVKEYNEVNKAEWFVYLINFQDKPLENVLISSTGYGKKDGKKVNTSTLRYYYEEIAPNSYTKIEPIIEDVFELANQYWVSFYQAKEIYDKKYVFLANTIEEQFFTQIPYIEKKGILIRA
ncbi:MAG: hypothetical protein AAF487_06470 [Bacteroidota bacterium]